MPDTEFDHRTVLEISRLLSPRVKIGIKIRPLGGLRKIGGPNCWLIESPSGRQLMLDCGQQIFDEAERIPLYAQADFSRVNFDNLEGVVLSHGHLDHISGIATLIGKRALQNFPVEIWGSNTTLKVLQRVLEKSEIRHWESQISFNALNGNQNIGEFRVNAHPVIHSIPETAAIVVEIGKKRICYLTDYKYMRSNWFEWNVTSQMFQEIARQDIDVLILDSSGIDADEFTPSISTSIIEFANIFQRADYRKMRILIANFSSDIETISDLATLANQVGQRPVSCDGSAMQFYFETFGIIKPDEQTKLDNPKVIFMTGSQAEDFSSLNRASSNENTRIVLDQNDVIIISSRTIPGNQERVGQMKERLRERVFQVISTEENPHIHVSGHEGLKGILQAVKDISPRLAIPCHAGPSNRNQLVDLINQRDEIKSITKGIKLDEGQEFII